MANSVVIATWPWGETAAKAALPLLHQGESALTAAIAGAQAVEDDPAVDSVGFGGLPNSAGTVSLDACVMEGKTLSCEGVGCVENIRHVARLARKVMEKTPHLLLVGADAKNFAIQHGFPVEHLLTPASLIEWERRRPKANPPVKDDSHDTVTVLTLDQKGSLGGACSTSGLAHKLPGRVGDSPLIGHGLYVDDTAGAAGATGIGEEIIRIGASLLVVEALRAGKTAQQACELIIRRINQVAARRGVHPARVALIALDPKGNVGSACTVNTKFRYAVGLANKITLHQAIEVPDDGK